ncbi:DUF4890 domain-containing protein [Algibacter sp. 2305UL17-15]|uniref:DUF4890 domain-containing protein n=1 Tax=Algibacter sp. 2305UL17-15 TaxID=3231268 RepID=UPI0034589EA0
MKKILMIALAICAIQITSAQANNRGQKAMDLAPEEMATLQTKKMTLLLDLNQSQQDDIYKINLENAKLRKAHMAERKAKREHAEATKPSKEQRLEMANKMLDHKIAMKAKMKNILNDEQYAKWEKAQAKRHAKMKGKAKKKHAGKRDK